MACYPIVREKVTKQQILFDEKDIEPEGLHACIRYFLIFIFL